MNQNQTSENTIIVTGCPNSGCEQVMPLLLDAFSDNDVRYEENFLSQSDENIGKNTDAKILLLYNFSDVALAEAIKLGIEPDEFLESWLDVNKQLITYGKKNKGTAILTNAQSLLVEYSTIVEVCNKLGIQSLKTSQHEYTIPTLELWVSSIILADNFLMKRLDGELEASSIFSDKLKTIKINITENIYKEFLHEKDKCLKNNELISENELLLLQLHHIQEELESSFLETKESLKRYKEKYSTSELKNQDLAQENTKLSQQNNELSQQNNELSQQNDLLSLQAVNINNELENYYFRNQQLVKKLDNLNSKKGFFKKYLTKRKLKKIEKIQIHRIEKSGLFDKHWYLDEYPDVLDSGIDPIRHYLMYGAEEGRNPSACFNTRFYLLTYPDVAKENTNPLYHFIMFGKDEDRVISG